MSKSLIYMIYADLKSQPIVMSWCTDRGFGTSLQQDEKPNFCSFKIVTVTLKASSALSRGSVSAAVVVYAAGPHHGNRAGSSQRSEGQGH